MEEVERLAGLAYPDAAAETVEVLAKDQFIDALSEEDFRLRLRQNKPRTLQQALEQALELESIYQANKQRSKVVREIQLESTPAAQVNKTLVEEGTLETLQCLLNAVQQCVNKPRGRQEPWQSKRKSTSSYQTEPPSLLEVQEGGPHSTVLYRDATEERVEQPPQPSERSSGGAGPRTQSGNGHEPNTRGSVRLVIC